MSSNNHSTTNTTTHNTHFWDKRRNKIETSIGKWIGGEEVFIHGHKMMADLLGNISYMQMLILNATGRLVEENLAKWVEGNFIGMSYPDSRIWCNQISALAGAAEASPAVCTIAGTLASDSRAYGGSQTNKLAMLFLKKSFAAHQSGKSMADIVSSCNFKKGKPVVTGFARPVQRTDERIEPHERMRKKLGFPLGEHLSFALAFGQYLEGKYGLGINIGAYSGGFYLDQGFSPDDVYRIKSLVVASGAMACAIDNHGNGANSFLSLQCHDIDYIGHPARELD
ncbi:MAG: hypothetical protein ACI8WB_002973 [Phenylobacterium sp.]|jgi:hypothetical protein